MTIHEHYSLQAHNTLSLNQKARYFVEVGSKDELMNALNFVSQCNLQGDNLNCLVIGDGSNIVFEKNFPGLIIKNAIKGIDVVSETDTHVDLAVGAGENWHDFVCYALKNNWFGLENLALIPGTVGAAPVQNIGAYGLEIQALVLSVEAWDRVAASWITMNKEACCFAYRDSVFKHQPNRFIITEVKFQLSKQPKVNVSYQALKNYFHNNSNDIISPQDVFDAVVNIRKSRLPDPAVLPNVGSFFKNPIIPIEHYHHLLDQYPQLAAYPVEDKTKMKLAAAWLIDQAGWKGVREGNVAVHDQQALVLVNNGAADGHELLSFANKIRQNIKSRYGIELEIEPMII